MKRVSRLRRCFICTWNKVSQLTGDETDRKANMSIKIVINQYTSMGNHVINLSDEPQQASQPESLSSWH